MWNRTARGRADRGCHCATTEPQHPTLSGPISLCACQGVRNIALVQGRTAQWARGPTAGAQPSDAAATEGVAARQRLRRLGLLQADCTGRIGRCGGGLFADMRSHACANREISLATTSFQRNVIVSNTYLVKHSLTTDDTTAHCTTGTLTLCKAKDSIISFHSRLR